MSRKMKILLVEDDKTLRKTLAFNLEKEGYEILETGEGAEALTIAREHNPDLIVLDIMLPTLDGLSVCRVLRNESNVPIVMLTARDGEVDRIIGLENGADDYIVKPFNLGEFLARVRAVLRRTGDPNRQPDKLQSGDLVLDLIARKATFRGEELRLTHKEFDLMAALMRNRGAVLSRDLLLERVWGYEYSGQSKTVDVHIRWLREKIEEDPSNPKRIVTVRGVGYRFEE
ncbi:MAG: DNA-binding response regulator [Phototrophicales bacterium]|nr:MAG: DNA-binding response regulator [Phototrophicales bacterium]